MRSWCYYYDYTASEVVVEGVESNQKNNMENVGLKDLCWMEGTEWCLLQMVGLQS